LIDLHTHSSASDGSLSPAELITRARSIGLRAIALTDHDTTDGLREAEEAAAALAPGADGFLLLSGVELEIEVPHGEFHLLGLGLSRERAALETRLLEVRGDRETRNAKILDRMRDAGVDIEMGDLTRTAAGEVVTRAHFARLMVEKGLVESVDQAFKRWLGKGKPFYQPKACIPLDEAIDLIAASGGKAVIAHPLSLDLAGPAFSDFLKDCRARGIVGLEAYHSSFALGACRRLEHLARRLGFFVTGGSDFHGDNIPSRRLGYSSGGLPVPDELLLPFLAAG